MDDIGDEIGSIKIVDEMWGIKMEDEAERIKTDETGWIKWFGFIVKWHINLRGLFNAKAILLEKQYG